MPLFGKPPPDPKEQVKEWKGKLRKEMRGLDRQISKIEREEAQVKIQMKQAAKKNQVDVAKVLAKGLVQSRKAKTRLHTAKAQINSVMMQMQNQLSMMKVSGAIAASADVMKMMNDLVQMSEIRETMMELGREMEKAGLIEEMVDDAFEGLEDEDLEDEADEEVDKVLFEVTAGILGNAGSVGQDLPERESAKADSEDDALMQRLENLRA